LSAIKAYAKNKRLDPPTRLHNAVRLVARLGGYIERGNQPPPGNQVMWRGYEALQLMAEGFSLLDESQE